MLCVTRYGVEVVAAKIIAESAQETLNATYYDTENSGKYSSHGIASRGFSVEKRALRDREIIVEFSAPYHSLRDRLLNICWADV